MIQRHKILANDSKVLIFLYQQEHKVSLEWGYIIVMLEGVSAVLLKRALKIAIAMSFPGRRQNRYRDRVNGKPIPTPITKYLINA